MNIFSLYAWEPRSRLIYFYNCSLKNEGNMGKADTDELHGEPSFIQQKHSESITDSVLHDIRVLHFIISHARGFNKHIVL